MHIANLYTTDARFRRPQSKSKTVSGLFPVKFVSAQHACIDVLQHKCEWMSFLSELIALIGQKCSIWKAIYARKQLSAIWKNCIERTPSSQGITT